MPRKQAETQSIDELARQIGRIASAIYPTDSTGGHDDGGCYVTSLTEAVMGATKALHSIAESNGKIADGLHAIAEAMEANKHAS